MSMIEILDAFDVKGVDDIDKLSSESMHYFVNRIYKKFEEDSKNLAEGMASINGLKLHYQKDGSVTDRSIEDVYHKKLAFLADRSVITVPVIESDSSLALSNRKRMSNRGRIGPNELKRLRGEGKYVFGDVKGSQRKQGGEIHVKGKAYVVNREFLFTLIDQIARCREGIESGAIVILPVFPDRENEINSALRKGSVHSGNFSHAGLIQQFSERERTFICGDISTVSSPRIFLPRFAGVKLSEVIKIRSEYAESFAQFQLALVKLMRASSEIDSEAKIFEVLREVDNGVRQVQSDADLAYKRYQDKVAGLLLCSTGVVFAPLIPHSFASILVPIIGSFALKDVFKATCEYRSDRRDVARSDFYIAWKLSQKGIKS